MKIIANIQKNFGCANNKKLVAPQGFEPRSCGPKPQVLPLDERALCVLRRSRTFNLLIRSQGLYPIEL
jgi:hypothetical protein